MRGVNTLRLQNEKTGRVAGFFVLVARMLSTSSNLSLSLLIGGMHDVSVAEEGCFRPITDIYLLGR